MARHRRDKNGTDKVKSLSQYMTPAWLAEAAVEQYFGDLRPGQTVADLTCGDGAFLSALPAGVKRLGIEIDAELACRAATLPNTEIIVGDVTTLKIERRVDAIVGNPPYKLAVFEKILQLAHRLLPNNGRAGLILPAYFFQTHATVLKYHEQWSLETTLIPRNVFPSLEKPLVFAIFTKEHARRMKGLAFFFEANEVSKLESRYREILVSARGSVWKQSVLEALRKLGGEADLDAIYQEMEGRRPSRTEHWKAKVRQVLRAICERVSQARYRLPRTQYELFAA